MFFLYLMQIIFFFVRLIGSVDSEICFKHSYQLYNSFGLGFDFFVLVVSSYIPPFHWSKNKNYPSKKSMLIFGLDLESLRVPSERREGGNKVTSWSVLVGRDPCCASPLLFMFPLHDPDTWLSGAAYDSETGEAAVTRSLWCAAANGSLSAGAAAAGVWRNSACILSSRPGWQGHTGAKIAEITRY